MKMLHRAQLGPAAQGMAASCLPAVRPLDNWLICQNLTEVFLVVTNLLLMLKSGANLLALLLDSDRLIADYNGALVFDATFRACFVLMNSWVFCGSGLCLAGLLLASRQESRAKLIKCFAISQITLALLVLAIMAKLWFAPLKLELSSGGGWQEAIRTYNYQFELDSNGLLPNSHQNHWQYYQQRRQSVLHAGDPLGDHLSSQRRQQQQHATVYKYQSPIDRLQRALGCCGIWSPDDWPLMNSVGLLAPSCCKSPSGLLASGILAPAAAFGTAHWAPNATLPAGGPQADRMEIFYCQAASSNLGCQRQIQDRATRFIFNLRLTLLLLLTILFLNLMTQASLEHCGQEQQRSPAALALTEALAQHQSRAASTSVAAAAGSNAGSSSTLWHLQQAPPAYQHRCHLAGAAASGSHSSGETPTLASNKCDIDGRHKNSRGSKQPEWPQGSSERAASSVILL